MTEECGLGREVENERVLPKRGFGASWTRFCARVHFREKDQEAMWPIYFDSI